MSEQTRHRIRLSALTLGAVTLVLGVVLLLRTASAAPYVNPFWTNTSPSQESAISEIAQLGVSPESVDLRTGELFWSHFLFRTPGMVRDHVFSLTWRSMISGSSQLGNGVLPSWETTAQYQVLIQGMPNIPGGHQVLVRRPTGRVDVFMWTGAAYSAPLDVFDTLTTTALGNYVLTDKWGNKIYFDGRGMPSQIDDRNGNQVNLTYDAAYRLTTLSDDRGKSYTIQRNANGYITSLQDPAGRTWSFTYDVQDNLKTVKTPTTPDQPTGITTTLNYDVMNRLTSVVDGRANAVWQFAYVGATGQVSSVTIDGNTITYVYGAGVTTRTDRNGNVHRTYFTGNQVTKTDMLVQSVPKYVTLFRYSGVLLSNVAFPRGNRIDFTHDGTGNLLTRRHRTTDTATNDPSDLVHTWTYAANFPSSYQDPRGNTWTFTRDGVGNLTGATNPTVTSPALQTSSKTWTYNAQGQVTQAIDEEGNLRRYTYVLAGADIGLLQKVEVDPFGLDLERSYTYDAAGNIATETDPRGNAWTLTWDNKRRLTERQAPAPLSYRVRFEYDGNGNRTKREVENVDKDGAQVVANPWFETTYVYTNTDDVASLTEEIDATTTRTTSFEYDANQNRIRVIKPEGNKKKWEFNERDWVVKHIRGEGATEEADAEYAYDENGNRTTFTDGRNNDTTFTFDLFDRQTKRANALGHYTEWEFDKNGNVTKVMRKDSSDVELQRETHSFDERSRHWKTSALFREGPTTHADAVTTIERFKTNQVHKVTDPRNNIRTRTLDAALRLNKIVDAMGNEWSYTLDGNGNHTAWSLKEIDGGTSVTHQYEATYDVLDRRRTFVEIDRNDATNKLTTTLHYDSRSNLVFRVNAENNPTRWTFDGLSRVTKRERALTLGATQDDVLTAQVTEWGFDKNSRMTSHKDDGTNASTWDYDALDRKTKLTYPDNKTCAYEYDDNDNVTKITDPAGNVVEDTYDVLNRNTSRAVTRATGFLGTTAETRQFDALNRITLNRDNDYQLEYAYSELGLGSLIREETQSYYGAANTYPKTVTKTYDAAGNRLSEVYPAGSNLSLSYTYNNVDALTVISDGTNTIATYGWIGLRKKTTDYQNGATRTNVYTGFRTELESVRHETSALATIVRLDYAYNKVHDKTHERFGGPGSSGDAFAYDKLRRLTTAWMGSSNPASPASNSHVQKIDYNMDDDGNRSSVVTTPYLLTPVTTSYTTNTLNKYTAVGGTTRTHDANGNLTDDGTFLFEYDYKNLIVKVRLKADSSIVATYMYDAEGRRVEKDVDGDIERYIRSRIRERETSSLTGSGEGGRYDMSHVVTAFGDNNVWRQNFVWSDDVDGIQVLEQADVLDFDGDANTAETTRSFYHRNTLGSVMEISDMNEVAVVSYRYGPYGKVTTTRGGTTQTTDPLGQHWTFTGRFNDEESGLHYHRARYYDAATGRFSQRDPLGYVVGPNLYEYVESRPTRSTDPSGLEPRRLPLYEEDLPELDLRPLLGIVSPKTVHFKGGQRDPPVGGGKRPVPGGASGGVSAAATGAGGASSSGIGPSPGVDPNLHWKSSPLIAPSELFLISTIVDHARDRVTRPRGEEGLVAGQRIPFDRFGIDSVPGITPWGKPAALAIPIPRPPRPPPPPPRNIDPEDLEEAEKYKVKEPKPPKPTEKPPSKPYGPSGPVDHWPLGGVEGPGGLGGYVWPLSGIKQK